MKVFVYSKKTNKKLTTITNVSKVEYLKHIDDDKLARVETTDDGSFIFDTKEVKIIIFIN